MNKQQEFYIELGKYISTHPEQRRGQTIFNVMHILHPDVANKYRSSNIDPFYIDENSEAFIAECFKEIT